MKYSHHKQEVFGWLGQTQEKSGSCVGSPQQHCVPDFVMDDFSLKPVLLHWDPWGGLIGSSLPSFISLPLLSAILFPGLIRFQALPDLMKRLGALRYDCDPAQLNI